MAFHRNLFLAFVGSILLTSCGGGGSGNNNSANTTYKVTLNSTWSDLTHPYSFPANAHYSRLIGATHNINTIYWKAGGFASPGIEAMAELGATDILTAEINDNINLGDSEFVITGSGLTLSPGSVTTSFDISVNYSFVTLVTMLAPSPDWFVGVSGLNLLENGVWVEKKTVELFAYDAGTDDGTIYTSPDADSNPKLAIQKIVVSPFLVNGKVISVGKLTFERILN